MAFSPNNRLTDLQRELLLGFFAREQRFFLTGGAALVGFHFAHRTTDDLDLFAPPGPDLQDAARVMQEACDACNAGLETLKTFADYRRLRATRASDACVIDLVIDRAPQIEAVKETYGSIRVDTLREIAANKICTLIARAEAKDMVDVQVLLGVGLDLRRAVEDAQRKDRDAGCARLRAVAGLRDGRPWQRCHLHGNVASSLRQGDVGERLPALFGAVPAKGDRWQRRGVARGSR